MLDSLWKKLKSSMVQQLKVLVPIMAARTRKRVPKESKDIHMAVIDVILKEIETEREC
jgi:hypothetical protein